MRLRQTRSDCHAWDSHSIYHAQTRFTFDGDALTAILVLSEETTGFLEGGLRRMGSRRKQGFLVALKYLPIAGDVVYQYPRL